MEQQKPLTTGLNGDSLMAILDKQSERVRKTVEAKKAEVPFDPDKLTVDLTHSMALKVAISSIGDKIELPHPQMPCVECNYARWMLSPNTLICRCKEFHEVVWTNHKPTHIVECDSWQPKSDGQE